MERSNFILQSIIITWIVVKCKKFFWGINAPIRDLMSFVPSLPPPISDKILHGSLNLIYVA